MGTEDDRRVRLQRGPESRFSQLLINLSATLDRRVGWDRLPLVLGLTTLGGLREQLRRDNLFDPGVAEVDSLAGPSQREYRTADGMWNDLVHPMMGAAESNFGRNVLPAANAPEPVSTLFTPCPRVVSRALLTREKFIPATTLNILAAAWLQFEVHDWFSHGKNEVEDPFTLSVEEDDPWPGKDRTVVIERTRRGDQSGVFRSEDTHWWDGSQIYGSTPAQQALLRDGPRLKVEGGTIPSELADHLDFRGQGAGFWTGWAMMHTLFALEHNAICEHLCMNEPALRKDEEKLFQTARMINVALMAKIHTVEWTPAILAHRTTRIGMRMNWWGISERLKRSVGRVSANEAISGIPTSATDHHGAPYCLTEEFVSSYRMHPLIPDEYVFRAPTGGRGRRHLNLSELRTRHAIRVLGELEMPTVLYTFGVSHPGAITLHNYPRTMQEFDREGQLTDLAATDILRDRERGVPRYNRFREAFHKPPLRTFDQLSDNPVQAAEIRDVYNGKIDDVDTMIGLYAEPRPQGFGFSDTAFRVFILMACRRLKSDRFFTECYNEKYYTKAGLSWIDNSSMKTVLLRHFGRELGDVLAPIENAFEPWPPVAG
ncbi:MAG: peroxidase family protein [Pseudonocardiaceae bacterium]